MMMPTQVIEMYQGNTSPDVELTLTRLDGSIVDLTGVTVDFEIQQYKTNNVMNPGHTSCFIVDAPRGVCRYDWHNSDLPAAALYDVFLRIVYVDGQKETYHMLIHAAPST